MATHLEYASLETVSKFSGFIYSIACKFGVRPASKLARRLK